MQWPPCCDPRNGCRKRDLLVVMIAMKMEYVIRTPKSGIAESVFFKVGDTVKKGVALLHFQEDQREKVSMTLIDDN